MLGTKTKMGESKVIAASLKAPRPILNGHDSRAVVEVDLVLELIIPDIAFYVLNFPF
jgi:hypothetical protein